MRNAFLFPGQGSQSVGMGQELYNMVPAAKELLDEACCVLGYDLKKLMFEGPAEDLTNTKFAQPAIYICSAMYLEKAKQEGLTWDYTAGHSLGEYCALYAAGVFSFVDGLKLINARANAMAEENGNGSMAAVLGLDEEELSCYIEKEPGVVIANLNTKTQLVISGEREGIERVIKVLDGRDDVTVKKLQVSAAFHSPQMANAARHIKEKIEALSFMEPQCLVASNVTGGLSVNAQELKTNLIAQVTGQVRWWEEIIAIKEARAEQFYECGHGDVLRRMNKGIVLRPKCFAVFNK